MFDSHHLDVIANALAAIRERLEALKELEVRVFSKDAPTTTTGSMAYVAYTGSPRFTQPSNPEVDIEQKRLLQFQVSLAHRSQRTDTDIVRIEQAVLALLTGFLPSPCHDGRLFPIATKPEPRDKEAFYWTDMVFGWIIDHQEGGLLSESDA